MSLLPSVDRLVKTAQDHLEPKQTLTSAPAGVGPGSYYLVADAGPFSVALPAATGSQDVYLFVGQSVETHPVTVTVPAGEALNGVFNGTFELATNGQAYLAVDQSPGRFVGQPWGQPGESRRVVALSGSDTTALAGSYEAAGGPAGSGFFAFEALSYYDQGVVRFATLILDLNTSDLVGLGFSAGLLPASASISSAQARVSAYGGAHDRVAPMVTVQNNGQEIYLRRQATYTDNVEVTVDLLILLADTLPLALMPGYAAVEPLGYAIFNLPSGFPAPVTLPATVSGWALGTRNAGCTLQTDGTYITGFKAGSTYTVSYTFRTVTGFDGTFAARRLADGQLIEASRTTILSENSISNETSLPLKEFVFLPRSASDGLALDCLSAPNVLQATTSTCTVLETAPSRRVGFGANRDSVPRGHLTGVPVGPLRPGIYGLRAPTQPYTLTLPPATGSQDQYVFLAQDTENHPCTVTVASGDTLDGVSQGAYVLNTNRVQVTLVDAAASSYVSMWLAEKLPESPVSFGQYNATAGEFQPAPVPSVRNLRSVTQYVSTGTLALTDTEQVVPQLSVPVVVKAGDVISAVACVSLTIPDVSSESVVVEIRTDTGTVGQHQGFYSMLRNGERILEVRAEMDPEPSAGTRVVTVYARRTGTFFEAQVDGARTTLIVWLRSQV